ncbi:restriction endonuclease subunit S [Nostoc sp.]|uniref:restriction endonuclease subunit S n=1 Tax=Nostoc sp. TaxID=1180 RepID=UPI002FEF1CFE
MTSKDLFLVPLREVLIKSEDWIDINPTEKYKQVTVKIWGKGVVERNEVTGAEIAASKRLKVHYGQFILSRIDARHGAFGLIPNSLDGAVVTSDFPVFTPNSQKILPQFLDWMSKTKDFIELCKAASEGTTNRVRLKEDKFLSMKIPLPPLEEQRRIVARVEELAGKFEEVRSLRQKSLEEAEVLRVSSAKLIFNELTQADRQPLRELVTVQGGGTPSKQNPFFWEGSIPWISPKDMKRREINDSIDHISEEATLKSPAKLLETGSVLIVVRGMILAHTVPSAILKVPAAINQDMKALIPSEKIISEYLCCVLWTFNDLLLELVEKSTHDTRKLETPKLLNFKIPVPPVPEQHRIVSYLNELQAKVDIMKRLREQAIKELDALLPSILDKAFKGEL